MSEDFTFEPNVFLEDQVAGLNLTVHACFEAAEAIAAQARATAPVVTGEYRDGIIAQPNNRNARVLAQAPHSYLVEFGWAPGGHLPTFNLRNAAVALGYKFRSGR